MKGYPSFRNMIKTNEIYRKSLPSESDVLVEHAIVLVGYGTNENEEGKEEHFFRCLNSYGDEWGGNGYGKIIRTSSSDVVEGEGKNKSQNNVSLPLIRRISVMLR
ncbi:Tubulointerstitial nephritis antigen [Linum perenne]